MNQVAPVSGNIIGPFSTPLRYESPEYSGFVGFAVGSVNDPLPSTAVILHKDSKGIWKATKSKIRTKFGNISWRGPKKKEGKEYPRWVLSYHGPQGRSIPCPYFTYGDDERHRNVYMGGGIVGIAPGPVLGACLREVEEVRYLVVICRTSGVERVISRKLPRPVFSDDDKALAELAKFSEDPSDVNGWSELGQIEIDGSYMPPDTPWFFNESGTEAQCMRRKEKTGVFNGVERAEIAADRFKLNMRGVFINHMGNAQAMNAFWAYSWPVYEGSMLLQSRTTYLDFYRWHRWWASAAGSGFWGHGNQVVAVDYRGDTEILATVRVAQGDYAERHYMEGMDSSHPTTMKDYWLNDWPSGTTDKYYNPRLTQYPISGQEISEANPGIFAPSDDFQKGAKYPIGQVNISYHKTPYVMEAPITPTEHKITGTRLLCGEADREFSDEEGVLLEHRLRKSDKEIIEGIEDERSEYLTFNDSIVGELGNTTPRRLSTVRYEESFVKYLDVRDGEGVSILTRLSSDDVYNIEPMPSTQTDRTEEEVNGLPSGILKLISNNDGKQTTFLENSEMFYPPIDMDTTGTLAAQYEEISTWPNGLFASYATTWTGSRPKDGDSAATNKFPFVKFIPIRQERWRDGWHGTLSVYHDKFYPNFPLYGACGDDYIVCGVSLGDSFGDFDGGSVLKSSIPDIESLVGAPMYYPFSEL